MKICFKCRRELSLDEFYAHPQMADGHLNKCKGCTRADTRANRRARIVEKRAYDASRQRTPRRRAQTVARVLRARERHPEKYRARNAVQVALANGSLTRQPCEVCGSEKSEAHHSDYSKPLEVRWLCRTHHLAEHGALVLGPF